MTFATVVVHYAPGLLSRENATAWCGRAVGFHSQLAGTSDPNKVTCRSCGKAMAASEREGGPTVPGARAYHEAVGS